MTGGRPAIRKPSDPDGEIMTSSPDLGVRGFPGKSAEGVSCGRHEVPSLEAAATRPTLDEQM